MTIQLDVSALYGTINSGGEKETTEATMERKTVLVQEEWVTLWRCPSSGVGGWFRGEFYGGFDSFDAAVAFLNER